MTGQSLEPADCCDSRAASFSQSPKPTGRLRYYEPGDRAIVTDFCKDVYGGRDYVPRLLAGLTSKSEIVKWGAYVLEDRDGIVRAFGRIYEIGSGYLFVDAVRVDPHSQGQGYGTRWLIGATDEWRRKLLSSQAHRGNTGITVVSSSIRSNIGMQRIFAKTNWTYRTSLIIWPNADVLNKLKTIHASNDGVLKEAPHTCIHGNRLLSDFSETGMIEILGASSVVHESSRSNAEKWHGVGTMDELIALVQHEGLNSLYAPIYYGVLPISEINSLIEDNLVYYNAHYGALLFITDEPKHNYCQTILGIISKRDTYEAMESSMVFCENKKGIKWYRISAEQRDKHPRTALFDALPPTLDDCVVYDRKL